MWSGLGVMNRRVSVARAEFTQAGRWGWGTIVLSDTLAADLPAVVTYRGALGVPGRRRSHARRAARPRHAHRALSRPMSRRLGLRLVPDRVVDERDDLPSD